MKKTLTTITMAAILTLGSTFANAGIIVAGRAADNCTSRDGIIVAGRDGILVSDAVGIIVAGLTGIIVAGAADSTPCTAPTDTDGIIVAG